MQLSESALNEFFSECDEILQRFSAGLSQTEKSKATSAETMDALYRDMHTLKGSAQLFGFQQIGQIAHAMEAALEPIRRLKVDIPPRLIDALFRCIDLIERLLKQRTSAPQQLDGSFQEEVISVVPLLLHEASTRFGAEMTLRKDTLYVSEGNQDLLRPAAKAKVVEKIGNIEASPPQSQEKGHETVTLKRDKQGIERENPPTKEDGGSSSSEASSTVRIQVNLLDKLMNLVGEMVLVRNQVLQYSQRHDDLAFLNLSQRLDIVTSELQGEVMKTRMQPIGSILSKFQRVVRDLGKDLGKQIELAVEGSETELDKTLLEAIKDPLTHIIRNSCDHGIESAEERAKTGKPPVGQVRVRANHEGGQVIIEVIDDGRGLNYKRILEKAIEKKIISPEAAKSMSEREIGLLIFAPGFSTADQISAVSGRGVGMDVVKTNLEKVGGQVELQSELGKGMVLRMRIPLTLAIVPALIVRVGAEPFAIPQIKLAELVRVDNDAAGPKIELLQGKPVFRLRGRLLSLVHAADILKLENRQKSFEKSGPVNIVVLNGDGDTFGLIVDEIKDTADIVVKPLPQFLKRLSAYSGATIMGDGTVSLILDIAGIAQKANLVQKNAKEKHAAGNDHLTKERNLKLEVQDFLFFKLNSTETYCLPLCLVNRLEEFAPQEIELSGSQRMVQYRGALLPILSLNEFLKLPTTKNDQRSEKAAVIVVQKSGRFLGVEVNEVADIISIKGAIEDPVVEVPGILGSIIVGEDVATVIDVFSILETIGGSIKEKSEKNTSIEKSSGTALIRANVLFAEDTVFFMKQVRKVLEKEGMKVTHAPDGEEAWNLLNAAKPGEFQLVLSDIEMPRLNGFELAEKIRADQRFDNIPVIALTTRFREADQERGLQVGFNRYLEKLKSDELIETIRNLLGNGAKK